MASRTSIGEIMLHSLEIYLGVFIAGMLFDRFGLSLLKDKIMSLIKKPDQIDPPSV